MLVLGIRSTIKLVKLKFPLTESNNNNEKIIVVSANNRNVGNFWIFSLGPQILGSKGKLLERFFSDFTLEHNYIEDPNWSEIIFFIE